MANSLETTNSADPITLFVLGVGGNVGQGIVKAIASSKLDCRVIGGCVSERSVGLFFCDHALVTPLASDANFVPWLIATCQEYGIQGILSGVEPVLNVLAQHQNKIERHTNAKIIVSPTEKLAISNDKRVTCEWLRDNGFRYPQFAETNDSAAIEELAACCGFPLFAKPRHGKGAKGTLTLNSSKDIALVEGRSDYIVQEYVGDLENEFTASTFTDREGCVRGCIVFRRQLLEGTTVAAEVVRDADLHAEAIAITKALKPHGPCNLQFRRAAGEPVCIEINQRFSGTTPLRAQLGFNDTELGIRHFVLGQPATDLPKVGAGVVLRYWNEVYVEPQAMAALKTEKELVNPAKAIIKVESCERN